MKKSGRKYKYVVILELFLGMDKNVPQDQMRVQSWRVGDG